MMRAETMYVIVGAKTRGMKGEDGLADMVSDIQIQVIMTV